MKYFMAGVMFTMIALKASGQIATDWIWVLSPLWGSVAFVFVFLFAAGMIGIAHKPRNDTK